MPARDSSIATFHPRTRAEWREWLAANHASSNGIWLIVVKNGTSLPGVTYVEAVEEALCFGWIDGRLNTLDTQSYKLYMSPRKAGSVWARLNKERIRKLVREGRMTPAGLAKIETARKDGSWNALDAIDRLEKPADLQTQLAANPAARRNFDAFSPSSRKIILFWIASAKREATRQKRIEETVRLAAQNLKAAHGRQSDEKPDARGGDDDADR
jgi:uncharacterized protein YdeI (YjbR/CyaY-like superfamily)